MRIPFSKMSEQYLDVADEIDAVYKRFMRSGSYMLGSELTAFESEYATYCGSDYCVGVGNGLDAMELVLRSWGVGVGCEVIVPSNTYIATWLAVSRVGATPIPIEPDPITYNLNPDEIEKHVSPRTRALIAVHLYGRPADMNKICGVCRQLGIKVLEDAAQAHGGIVQSKTVGSLGDAAAHSFYPTKNLGAFGDGGAVTTDDAETATQVRLFRNYGSRARYTNDVKGANSRLDELQAAFLRVKLKKLNSWNKERSRKASMYTLGLNELKNNNLVRLPVQDADQLSGVWHLYVIQCRRRNELQKFLENSGIATLIHYPTPPHLSGAYASEFSGRSYPIAVELAENALSLPIGPHHTDTEIMDVIKWVKQFFVQLTPLSGCSKTLTVSP